MNKYHLDDSTIEHRPQGPYYIAAEVDARIAELERCLDGGVSCTDDKITMRSRIAELERDLAEAKGMIETMDRANDRLRLKLDAQKRRL